MISRHVARRFSRFAVAEAAAVRALGNCEWCRIATMHALRCGELPGWCEDCGRVPPVAAVRALADLFGYAVPGAV
jgi:hypothetical protein